MTKGKGRNPGAGNLDKHLKRKEHKERTQPAARRHLGQLEKHKDHVIRSKKRKVKVQRLLQLKRAAAQRNPDEFDIGMTKAVMDVASGRMKARRKLLTPEGRLSDMKQAMSLNTRNVQYLEHKAQSDYHRARELLEEGASTALTAGKPVNKHTVFVEDEEEFKQFNTMKFFDATPQMMEQHPALRGKISVLRNTVLPDQVLLSGGHTMKSAAQRRKERREVQEKLLAAHTQEDRANVLERMKAKMDLKQCCLSDLVAKDLMKRQATEIAGTEEGAIDEVSGLLQLRHDQENQETLDTARRMKEITQRMERSKSLNALAKTVRYQNSSIKKQLTQKADARFKPTVQRRSR